MVRGAATSEPSAAQRSIQWFSPHHWPWNRLGSLGARHQRGRRDNLAHHLHRYDLGYIDLEQRTLQPLDNPPTIAALNWLRPWYNETALKIPRAIRSEERRVGKECGN